MAKRRAKNNLRKLRRSIREGQKCPTCADLTMVPSDDPNGDVMNTPCPTCNAANSNKADMPSGSK